MRDEDDQRQLNALRDMYAGGAMGLFSMDEKNVTGLLAGETFDHQLVARFCFDLADAMIAERAKRSEK